jgi:hypothetical protein
MLRERLTLTGACVACIACLAPAAASARPVKSTKQPSVKVAHTGVVAIVHGGSTGDGPMNDDGCEQVANVVQNRIDGAEEALDNHDVKGAVALLDEADKYEGQGMAAGCFFYNTPS